MKKISKLFLGVTMLASLASMMSCSGKKKAAAFDPNTPVELTIWTHEDENRTALETYQRVPDC